MRPDLTSREVTLQMPRSKVSWFRELRGFTDATIIMQRLQFNRIKGKSNTPKNKLRRKPVKIRAIRESKALTKPSRVSNHKHSH